LLRAHQSLDATADRDRGGMKKLPEPIYKPFIPGLAEDIFGPRARFFIWLPFTTHPAEPRARRDSCRIGPMAERFKIAPSKGILDHLCQDTWDWTSTSSSLKAASLMRKENHFTGVVLPLHAKASKHSLLKASSLLIGLLSLTFSACNVNNLLQQVVGKLKVLKNGINAPRTRPTSHGRRLRKGLVRLSAAVTAR
jgi:hypothetical protein